MSVMKQTFLEIAQSHNNANINGHANVDWSYFMGPKH